MISKHNPEGYSNPLPGLRMKTICYGDKTLMAEFHLAGGTTLPYHTHPHEQTGYMVSGHLIMTVEGEEFDIMPGDSWCVPGDTYHGVRMIEDSVAVEVFSPVREDYLP